MRLRTGALARTINRRPWVTITVWIAAITVAGTLSYSWLGDALTTDMSFTNDPESKRALELLEERFGRTGMTEIFVLRSETATVEDRTFRLHTAKLQKTILSFDREVLRTMSFFDTKDRSMVSEDGHAALLYVSFVDDGDTAEHENHVQAIRQSASRGGFSALSLGEITLSSDFSRIADEDLRKGEALGVLIALIVLLAVFGAIVAGLVPIAMAITSIAVAVGLVATVGRFVEFNFFVLNMLTMMGLAVGIDYSLFIVSRYREERAEGSATLDAIARAGDTASRAVFFSGMTVVFALIGMFILPDKLFRSLAAGAIFVVVVTVLASLTLLPALLSLLGDRIDSLRVFRHKGTSPGRRSSPFWDGMTHRVMRRPVLSIAVVGGALLLAASSYLDIKTGLSGVSTLPDNSMSKRAFLVLNRDFSGAMDSPLEVVVDGDVESPAAEAGISKFQDLLRADDLFGPSTIEINEARDLALISVPIKADPWSNIAIDSIARIREDFVPRAFGGVSGIEVLVGGETAIEKDFLDITTRYTPIVFLFVLGMSFVLLTIVFRSIVVPIKAIIMNLLSVGAAYGIVVLVNQNGVGAQILGFRQVEAIEAWLPLFLFSVLFGLSMDYHVFLLSRIRERFDETHDNAESVAYGLRSTGKLITGAAFIMVAVFGGFATGNLVMMQQMGFGLAVAVLLDATLVRSVLVPATMKLLGDRNWYLPSWLEWLPKIGERDSIDAPVEMPEARTLEPVS